jgi:hypothetical protein
MLITFFVGNGFDLNNGMNTKFTDFYNYIQEKKSPMNRKLNDIYSNIEKDIDSWSYFEMQLGLLTFEYDQVTKDNLLDDIEEFREDFIEYMTEQNKKFSFDKSKAQEVLVKSLTEYMYQLDKTEKDDLFSIYSNHPSQRQFNFINFNYTDTLEQVMNVFKPNQSIAIGTIIPIHKQLQTGMFLGVNDETQINSKIFDELEQISLIKPLSNDEFRDDTNQEVESIVDNSNIVVIYGMSLGETDKKWWEYLVKWLEKNPNNRLIMHVYDKEFFKISPLKFFKKRKEYEDRFIGFSYDLGDLTNKDIQDKIKYLRSKIYLISNSDSDFKFPIDTYDSDMNILQI